MELTDPEQLARLRTALGKLFLSSAREIEPDLYLTPATGAPVESFWVNSAAPETTDRIIIYLHGGGHVLGSARTNLASAVRVALAGIPVLTVEYRLAPENLFPAGLEDALTVYEWLLDSGYSGESIGVYGDSAGGSLSLGLTLLARQEGLPLPGAVAALSPSIDFLRSGDSYLTLAEFDPVVRSASAKRDARFRGETPADDPLLSPLYADYSEFPPLLIQTGTRDRYLSDSVRLARAVRAQGSEVTLDVWDGMWHVWQDSPGIPEAEQACRELAAFFERNLLVTVN